MPIPFLLAAALMAASTGANYIGSKKAQGAQQDAMRAERIRQKNYDKRAYATNDKSRERYKGFEGQAAQQETSLADLYTQDAPEAPVAQLPTSSNISVARNAEEQGKAKAATDDMAGRRAALMSLGETFGGIDRGLSDDFTRLGQIDSFRRGSQGVLGLELDEAQSKGDGWRLAGDILGGAGSIASMGALTGANMPGMAGMFAGGAPTVGGATGLMPRPKPGAAAGGGLLSLFGG